MYIWQRTAVWFGVASLVALLLFAIGVFRNGTIDYWYLPSNLMLAYIPLGLMLYLGRLKKRLPWQNWRVIVLSMLWLLFLPNSFYIVTDFIHLPETSRVDVIQDIVMLAQFSVVGMIAGFASLYMMHKMLLQKIGRKAAMAGAISVLYVCSFAIFLGRELRWNSWDIVVQPFSVAGDVLFLWSSAFAEAAFWMTVSFFMLLVSLYLMIWYGANKKQFLSDQN